MTLTEWLHHLEFRYHDEIKLGLTRIKLVANKLNLLSPEATVIMVAGTNGKGTTVAALESIYQQAGYRVGAYTSPHLISFNERIKVNGQCIDDQTLCQLFYQIEETRQQTDLTYFETATLAALLYFKQQHVDVMILEIGLGGRLDATNILDPDLSIITTIDYDHQALLGNTLDQIGFEKAGILRSATPLIYADDTLPQSILLTALTLKCPMYIKGIHYHYRLQDNQFIFNDDQSTSLIIEKQPWHPNALAAAIMATLCLQSQVPVKTDDITHGLQLIALNGRQQFFSAQVTTLLDVSHNVQSVNYLAATLRQYQGQKKIHAVFSAMADKDIESMLQPMLKVVDYWYLARLPGKRAATIAQLQSIFRKYGIMVESSDNSPLDAYQLACQTASLDDLIVVYGSFLTVSHVLANLNQ